MLNSLNKFLNAAKENMLWTLATGLFMALLTFLLNFIPSVPSRYIDADRKEIEFHNYASDGESVIKLYKILKDSGLAFQDAFTHFDSNFLGASDRKSVSSMTLTEGREKLANAKQKLLVAVGTLKGMDFYNPRLTEFKKGFGEDLKAISSQLSVIEEFYLTMATGPNSKFSKSIESLKSANQDSTETLASLLSRVETFDQQSLTLQKEWSLAVDQGIVNIRWLNTQAYFAIIAIVYEVGFIIIGVWSWLKSSKQGNPTQ